MYAPEFLKRGIKSLFVKFVQSRVESVLGDWFIKGYDVIGIDMDGFFTSTASNDATGRDIDIDNDVDIDVDVDLDLDLDAGSDIGSYSEDVGIDVWYW